MRQRDTAGFTIMELLIVVAMIGLLTVIAVPRLGRSIESSTAKSAASVVAADLEAAFATAARARRPVTLTCNCTALNYAVADQSGGTVRLSRTFNGSSGMQITSLAFSPSTGITIAPNGLASSALSVRIGVGGSGKRVVVSRTGLVRIQD